MGLPVDNLLYFTPQATMSKNNSPSILDETVSKNFLPFTEGETLETGAFYKDFYRQKEVLIYGNQSIFERFEKEFTTIESLETLYQEVRKDSNLTDEQKEALYEELQEAIDQKKSSLEEAVKTNFNSFLEAQLGPKRSSLKEPILSLFSPKALTAAFQEVSLYTTEKYRGRLLYTDGEETATLTVPQVDTSGALIEFKSRYRCDQFQPEKELPHPLANPIELRVQGVYKIALNHSVKGLISFSLSSLASK